MTQAAKTALEIIRAVHFAKRPKFQTMIGDELGRDIGDDEFETIMTELRCSICRQRGAGGGIWG